MVYALKIAEPSLQVIVRIGFHSIDNIHVRRGGADRDYLDQTLAVGIGGVVNPRERVALGYDIGGSPAVCRHEVF